MDQNLRVLYVFNSKTSLYNDFNIHANTLVKFLYKENKFYNYFTFFSTNCLKGSDLDNLLSLAAAPELIYLKASVDLDIPLFLYQVQLLMK